MNNVEYPFWILRPKNTQRFVIRFTVFTKPYQPSLAWTTVAHLQCVPSGIIVILDPGSQENIDRANSSLCEWCRK